jgi:hypothetical protein
MLPATLLLLFAFDPPAFERCAALPWEAADAVDGVTVEDHPLGKFDGHEARARVCLEYSGYGYTRVSFVIWVGLDDGAFRVSHLEHGMTACPVVEVRRRGEVVTLRTSACAYSDDTPTGTIQTRLRWHHDPPRLEPTVPR